LSKHPAVYILANRKNGTIYTGVTSALIQRFWQDRTGIASGFASKHGCKFLVWYGMHESMESAIAREKQIKARSRAAKGTLGCGNKSGAEKFVRQVVLRTDGLPRRLRRLAMTNS
jgi:putative endonuclease